MEGGKEEGGGGGGVGRGRRDGIRIREERNEENGMRREGWKGGTCDVKTSDFQVQDEH